MPQFFLDKKFVVNEDVEIRGRDARHISQVLRLARGDWIVLSDGVGKSYRAQILSSAPTKIEALIEMELPKRILKAPPTVALAIIKPARFEWALEKLVELGCIHIMPYYSARTNQKTQRHERWQKIAIEAAKQSGLAQRPIVAKAVDLMEVIRKKNNFDCAVLFYEGESQTDIADFWQRAVGKNHLVIIGPEGGFTSAEIANAKNAGVTTLSLGTQILRVETAAVAALAIWQYNLGNLSIEK